MKTEENEIMFENESQQQNCTVEQVANIDRFGLCKVIEAAYCKHMVNYGFAKYCFHPNWRSFIEKESERINIPK